MVIFSLKFSKKDPVRDLYFYSFSMASKLDTQESPPSLRLNKSIWGMFWSNDGRLKIFSWKKIGHPLVKWGKQIVQWNCGIFRIYFLDWKHFIMDLVDCCWQETSLRTLILTDWVFEYSCNAFFKLLATILFLLDSLSWRDNVLQLIWFTEIMFCSWNICEIPLKWCWI